ncbi:MAG: 3-oxoacyl-ACP reductase FabG [Saprospiraceae bacterium]|nr:3-oxoacyl-ACP reductase FabG [Saprospiraceae bacterium]
MKRLENKVAIITGGARGIGKATAEKFIREGAAVAIWDIDAQAGQATAAALAQSGGKAKFYSVNTTDLAATEAAAAAVVSDFGRIDILVNNAGITRDASMKKMTEDQWNQVIGVNLTGVYHCTKAVSPYLVDQGYGRILNASSVVGLYGNFGQTNYVASKAGVIGMTKVWAREFGRKGVTVNAVAPGFINTEMMETVPQTYLDELKSKTPMARMGEAVDIANAYAFLASDEASFITGTVLSVDGGLIL